jgi:hypothetical protein
LTLGKVEPPVAAGIASDNHVETTVPERNLGGQNRALAVGIDAL